MPIDANSLSMGAPVFTGTPAGASQAVIIQNPGNANAQPGTVCVIDKTTAISLDLLKISNCSGQVLQWLFTNGSDANALLIWNGNMDHTLAVSGSSLFPGLSGSTAYANEVSTVLESSLPATAFVNGLRRFNDIIGKDGIVFSSLAIQVNVGGSNAAANQAFIDNPLVTFTIPINPNDSYNTVVNYPDFCDACYSTSNGNNVTRSYDMPLGVSRRTGFYLTIPATANGTVRGTVAAVALPNNEFEGGSFTIGA